MKANCLCGNEFNVAQWQLRQGRGKYCSKACLYEYRIRPSGLTYDITQENKGWIKEGQRLSPETEFKKGELPWNFKGDQVGYDALHDWVKRYKGKAEICEDCESTDNVQWANISWEYKRELDDWSAKCYHCHRKYDMNGNWGAATRKFPELQRRKRK